MLYCASCQTEVDITKGGTCPSCGSSLSTPILKNGNIIVTSVKRPKSQRGIVLATTVDRTGSSDLFKVGIPSTYEIVVTDLAAKTSRMSCWLASHGDLDEGQKFIIHTSGGTPDEAIADIKKITYGGGGDPEENHLDAIESLVNTIPWENDPAHTGEAILAFMTADTKPTKSGITAKDLGDLISKRGILLYLVCEPTPNLQELIDASGGLMFQISNSPDPTVLQKIAGQLAASIAATVASGSTIPMAAGPTSNV